MMPRPLTTEPDRDRNNPLPAEALEAAVESGWRYLLKEADRDFAEARHTMTFPRRAGFIPKSEVHSSDIFARATLANLLLDCVELTPAGCPFRAATLATVRRESRYVAQAKLTDRAGGWSYFPTLPELPPDRDSLATVIKLFARAAPEQLALCKEPLKLALAGIEKGGGAETWLIAPDDPPALRRIMARAIAQHWGEGPDVDVCANFYGALLTLDRSRYAELVRMGAEFILARQRQDATWDATWYWGRAYVVDLCLGLLQGAGLTGPAIDSAAACFQTAQRADGGWGEWQTIPLETALTVWVMARANLSLCRSAIRRGVVCLVDYQTRSGSWKASPWIKMDTGRARNKAGPVLSYQSRTLTTAFCLRTLLLFRKWCGFRYAEPTPPPEKQGPLSHPSRFSPASQHR